MKRAAGLSDHLSPRVLSASVSPATGCAAAETKACVEAVTLQRVCNQEKHNSQTRTIGRIRLLMALFLFLVGPRWPDIPKTHMALTWVRIKSGLIAWNQVIARLKNAMV